MDRPLSRVEFWERHPLTRAFGGVFDRLQTEPCSRCTGSMDQEQWDAVKQAVEREYVRYLRTWSRSRMDLR